MGGRGVWLAMLTAALGLAACEYADPDTKYPRKEYGRPTYDDPEESVFGPDGLVFGNRQDETPGGAGGTGIGVNAFLWRASLDTLSFMPLSSADPFGGVIITEWYSPPESPQERFKVNVFILGRDLRADGVRATVFRQSMASAGTWVDSPVGDRTGVDLENAILTRARQLRIAALQ